MDGVLEHLKRSLEMQAGMLRRTLDGLSDQEFAQAPGETAPPIGWHLWHIARWGDRFQATLRDRESPREIWVSEGLAEASGLAIDDLGVLQLGMGMDAKKAQRLPVAIGKERFRQYQDSVLAGLAAAVDGSDAAELLSPRLSMREYGVVNGVPQYAPAQESTLLADILFHLTHSGRHLGSVDALRGL